jgi:hypothetical protein
MLLRLIVAELVTCLFAIDLKESGREMPIINMKQGKTVSAK